MVCPCMHSPVGLIRAREILVVRVIPLWRQKRRLVVPSQFGRSEKVRRLCRVNIR
jgi:hypothetical protein